MSKLLSVFAFAVLAGLLALSGDGTVAAQDCERVIKGNTNSPCKKVNYLAGLQSPTFTVERTVNSAGDYYCRPVIEFRSATPLSKDDLDASNYHGLIHGNDKNGVRDLAHGSPEVLSESIRFDFHWHGIKLTDPVPDTPPRFRNYLWVHLDLSPQGIGNPYRVNSKSFPRPAQINDYSLLMNQCLAGISRQLEHEAALEAARQQAETAAEEAANAAEIAAIELQSAQDALTAQESLNAALLQETILAIKREDAIRAAWQQVILVRMAGLEERTRIWNEAVERWAAEDLQFSTAMAARIEEVERLQALNAALEQSMSDQRKLLIARLEDLEQAEWAAMDARNELPQTGSQGNAGGGSGQ